MKSLFFFIFACLFCFGQVSARDEKPKRMAKTTHSSFKKSFSHGTESGKGRTNDHAHFRRDNHPPTLNLHPHDPERFTKARVNKNYKYSKGSGY